jgi:alpha-glucosidase
MALMLTLRGSVSVYQGEELGLPHIEVPRESMRDPYGIAFYPAFRGRDAGRTPMPWTADPSHAGFTTSDRPWLPVPEAHRTLAVAVQEADSASVLASWRQFLAARRQHSALRGGAIAMLDAPAPVLAFRRQDERESLVVLLNLSGEPVALDRQRFGVAEPLPGLACAAILDANIIRLESYGYLIATLSGEPAQKR